MDLHNKYPAISDLKARARKRIPYFVWEYLESGTGDENTLARNRTALDAVRMMPSILHGEIEPDLSVELMGRKLPLPFGIAPIGMSGLLWPDAEARLARGAAEAGIPYSLSTVAATTPEHVAPSLGDEGWFQLYPPKSLDMLDDMLARGKAAGFHTLAMTVDVPVSSRRERQLRSGITNPPKLTPRLFMQVMQRPAWALGTLRNGAPRMRLIDSYTEQNSDALPSTAHMGYLLRTSSDFNYLREVRKRWDGPLVLKGVLDPVIAAQLKDEGVDALWVSNHGGRQFDGAPASIEVLPALRAATDLPLIFDSGIEGGLDILRAYALGADFVMLGRAWHFALAALGDRGIAHLVEMLSTDLAANMGQLGIATLKEAKTRLLSQ